MEYLIVVFRSRSHTVKFHSFLEKNGIFSQIVNTPKELGVGCGLSVKVNTEQLQIMKKAIKIANLSSFIGIFKVKKTGGSIITRSI